MENRTSPTVKSGRKAALAILLVASFVGMAVLNLLTMDHAMRETSHPCVAAMTEQKGCPPVGNADRAFAFHLEALQKILQAIPQNPTVLLVLLVLTTAFGFTLILAERLTEPIRLAVRQRFRRMLKTCPLLFRRQIGRWLKFTQKRDPSALLRVQSGFGYG